MKRGLGILLPPKDNPLLFESNVMSPSSENKEDTEDNPYRTTNWHEYVHCKIKPFSDKLRKKVKTIQFSTLLEDAGLKLQDLPEVRCSDENGKYGLCYKFLLGRCERGTACSFVHLPLENLKEEKAEEMAPILEKLVSKVESGQQGGKKQKRVAIKML